MRKIPLIKYPSSKTTKTLNVAAYVRVSVDHESSIHSFYAQVSYYTKLINANPAWALAGIYADKGISGTEIKFRSEFQRLLADCKAGKIDIILTKSISRFARNTVDLLKTVRELRSLGIEIRFEREGISSATKDGELMLSILASFAQEEAASISSNVKWGIRKRFKKGIPNNRPRIYGYRWSGQELKIEPDEAAVVKKIFSNFLEGKSRLETEREFAEKGIKTMNGGRWVDSTIKGVLNNITYTGNLLLQKSYVSDPITHKKLKNRGELPKYFVEHTHEAIIDKAVFDHVQAEMERRRHLGVFANKSIHITCFTGKIRCEHCGRNLLKKTRKSKAKGANGKYYVSWRCPPTRNGKKMNKCPNKPIPEVILKRVCADALGLDSFDEKAFLNRVDYISVPRDGELIFHMKDGDKIDKKWENTWLKELWTPEMKAAAKAFLRNYWLKSKKRRGRQHATSNESHDNTGDCQ